MSNIQHLEIIEKNPEGEVKPTPILFIHGAWHGAWCWNEFFIPYFAGEGYQVKALSLRGHGQSAGRGKLRTARIADYVSDVASVVRTFSSPPVLVGHSMGGMVVQKYLESESNPAVSKAILLAPVPPHGVWKVTLNILANHPLVFLKVNLLLKLFPIVSTPERTREYFFSPDISKEQLDRYSSKMQDESYLAFLDMLLFNLPKPGRIKTQVEILAAENDAIFSLKDMEAMAVTYGTKARIFKGMAHDMMLEKDWQEVANCVMELI